MSVVGNLSRRGRIGSGLMALGLALVAAGVVAAPVGASGETTTVVLVSPLTGTSTAFTWSYQFNQNGGNPLENIALRLCNAELLSHVVSASPNATIHTTGDVPGGHAGFGPGIRFNVTAATGTLMVIFDQPYGPGGAIEVQSYSGDGRATDPITIGEGPGPACPNSVTTTTTTTTTIPPETTTIPPETTTTSPRRTTTTEPRGTTTTEPQGSTTTEPQGSTTTSTPGGGTTTTDPPEVTTTTDPPQDPTTTTLPGVTTSLGPLSPGAPLAPSTTIATEVLGARFTNDAAALATTGSRSIGVLVVSGVLLAMIGLGLLVGDQVDPRRARA